jgi:DNA recombination protein RmuC
MDPVILLIIVLAALVIVAVFINKKLTDLKETQKPSDELLEYLRTTNTRLDEQNKNFTRTLSDSTRNINERLDNAARVISGVQKNIGEFSEIGRGMKDLQEFLSSPKLRGNIGEQVLKELLKQFLPKESFNLQYTFKSGEKVDAAIKTSGGIIPIDSKFPMENFRKMSGEGDEAFKKIAGRDFERDVKKHIDDIARKYILTEEGTIDYALMYIPSESIYYEIVNNQELFDYAGDKRVLPVSPTTFYAYLKAILMSFEGQKIEAQAKEILSSLRAIQKDYEKTNDTLSVLQKHLTNAYNTMANVFASFGSLGQKISSTQNLGSGVKKGTKVLD